MSPKKSLRDGFGCAKEACRTLLSAPFVPAWFVEHGRIVDLFGKDVVAEAAAISRVSYLALRESCELVKKAEGLPPGSAMDALNYSCEANISLDMAVAVLRSRHGLSLDGLVLI